MSQNQIALSAAALKTGWDTTLRHEATPGDILGDVNLANGVFRDKEMPNDSFMSKVKATGGEKSKVITLLKDLTGAGKSGTGVRNLLGSEEKQVMQERKIFADELAHGVSAEMYGVEAFTKNPYKIIEAINPQIAEWHKKQRGRRIRQAIVEGYDAELTTTGNQTGMTAANAYIHRNAFVCKATDMVTGGTYSATAATYGGNLYTAAHGVVADPTDLSVLDSLSEQIVSSASTIKGIQIAGKERWILTVPPRTATIFRKLLRGVNQYTDGRKALASELGEYGNFIIVEDVRAPRITLASGTAAAVEYFGVSDGRAAAAADKEDVGMILGAGALIEYEMEALNYRMEEQFYGRYKGIGAFVTTGFNRTDWDTTANTNSTDRKNYSSGIVIFNSI